MESLEGEFQQKHNNKGTIYDKYEVEIKLL